MNQKSKILSQEVSIDDFFDAITICGVRYSGDLFRQLGGLLPIGKKFRLIDRKNGVITIETQKQKGEVQDEKL